MMDLIKREESFLQDFPYNSFKASKLGQLRQETMQRQQQQRAKRSKSKGEFCRPAGKLARQPLAGKTSDLRVCESLPPASMRTLPTTIPEGPFWNSSFLAESCASVLRLSANCQAKRRARPAAAGLLMGLLVLVLLALLGPARVEAIKLQPEGREKFYWSGEQFIITCQNNNNIKNVKFRWLGPNNADITEHRDVRVHTESAGPHGHRLVVLNATAGVDDGLYRCQLGSTDDRTPRETTEFNLKLFRTTSFRDTPRHVVLPVGSKGHLNCHVQFDPSVIQPTVSWHRDQKPIEMFNDTAYSVMDYDPGKQMSQLVIRPVARRHDGVYSCRADAITSHLSKISEHEIRLESNYAPVFDSDSPQTIWVERFGSGSAATGSISAKQQQQQQQNNVYSGRPSAGTGSSYQKANRFRGQSFGGANRRGGMSEPESPEASADTNSSQIIKVELKCTCQANPPASILWTASDNRPFVLAQGEPAHVLQDPRTETDGHNTTSTLTIGYNLDPSWAHRQTSYICSASNQIGSASMDFKIEQGDPPPAFAVGPQRAYNPDSSMFGFTLLGPNFDPDSQQPQNQHQQSILPPVDSFRIRAESSSGAAASGEPNQQARQPASEWQKARSARPPSHNFVADQASSSVQWSIPAPTGSANHALPQTLNVSLARLPSGNQRLFLEAHNAVGWSPNATYLGDYYIVSAAGSPMRQPLPLVAYLLVLGSALLAAYGLMAGAARPTAAKLTGR